MKIKRFHICIGVALFCAGSAIIPITAAALVLPIQQTYIEEGKNNWSWAACSQAVMEYFGVSLTQVEIGDYGTSGQDIPNVLFGNSEINRHGVDEILLKFADLHSAGHNAPITSQYTAELINHFRTPVLIRWVRDISAETSPIEFGGRVVVIKGARYADNRLYLMLMDPVDGTYEQDYDWVVKAKGHIWAETLEIVTRPSNDDKFLLIYKAATGKMEPILLNIDSPAVLENPDWDGIHTFK